MKKPVYYLLLVSFTGLFLFSSWRLVSSLLSYKEGQNSYASLEQYISFETAPQQTEVPSPTLPQEETALPEEPTLPETETVPFDPTQWPEVDFDQLSQINPDIVGWIYLEGTNINYPIVQGSDNDYYLNHLFDKRVNASGSIFLDTYCSGDFSDRHSILYGHHMKDGTMFQNLMAYKDPAFFTEHPEALLMTPEYNYKIRFFSGYVSDTWSNAWELKFTNIAYADWIDEIIGLSCFPANDVPGPQDRVITLSTCSYEFNTAKFVLHGYIVQQTEAKLTTSGN